MKTKILLLCIAFLSLSGAVLKAQLPWEHGDLQVSASGRYLQHADGTPFFWLGDTGWLMPERLNREEVEFYLEQCRRAGYNVVQVQTVNAVPAMNCYGQSSMPDGFCFDAIDRKGVYGYWDHMDYIVRTAATKGIYIGMVCIWGGLVKQGWMNEQEAQAYGTFLARRYQDDPNIVWIIGGDIRGDVKTEVWTALATAIKSVDRKHLMTFHPFGRTLSATWFNEADWLDFNMFQSGHRRYGQLKGDGDDTMQPGMEEDNWRYVQAAWAAVPAKPVLDAEPSYEGIPQGLHNPDEPRWQAADVRRYAYWSVFAGACGHTYGNNSIMQFYRPGYSPAYGADKNWVEALNDEGFRQMQWLKRLMLAFPYFDRIPDQQLMAGQNGERYDRLVATRGKDYLLVYNHTARPMQIDVTRIEGDEKKAWWYDVKSGKIIAIGRVKNEVTSFRYDAAYQSGADRVLIVTDARKTYVEDHLLYNKEEIK